MSIFEKNTMLQSMALVGLGAVAGACAQQVCSEVKKRNKAKEVFSLYKKGADNVKFAHTLGSKAPIVICHRGSGYHPEHTIQGYEDVIECEPDYIEFDVVSTKDHELIIRHDVLLDGTTNVSTLEQYKSRFISRLAKSYDGEPDTISGFFACDFTLAEIKTMAATQRWSWRNMVDDDGVKYTIPTVYEAACAIKKKSDELGLNVGLYIETKRPEWHEGIGLPLERKLVEEIARSGFTGPIIMQSFEEESLRTMKKLKPEWPRVKLLIDVPTAQEYHVNCDRALPDDNEPEKLDEFYAHLSTYANGAGIWKDDVVKDPLHPPDTSNIIDIAHKHDLVVHLYTFRSDIKFLPRAYGGNPTEEYMLFLKLGVDGVFSDFAEHAVHARDKCVHCGSSNQSITADGDKDENDSKPKQEELLDDSDKVYLAIGDEYPMANLRLVKDNKEEAVQKAEEQRKKMAGGANQKATKYVREEKGKDSGAGPSM